MSGIDRLRDEQPETEAGRAMKEMGEAFLPTVTPRKYAETINGILNSQACPTCGLQAERMRADGNIDYPRIRFQCKTGHEWTIAA